MALRLRDLVALRGEGEEGGGREEEGGGKEEERGGREDEGGGARDEGGGRRKEGGGTRERESGRKKEGGISEPEALTRFVGGPKSRVCRQARKGSQNTRFLGDLEAFRGRRRPQALWEVQSHEFAGRPGKGLRTTDLWRFEDGAVVAACPMPSEQP